MMVKKSEFFERTPPYKEEVWWDLKADAEYPFIPTGTPWDNILTRLQRRVIERIYGKVIHRGCGGDKFEIVPDKSRRVGKQIIIDCNCEDPHSYAVKCLKCGVVECIEW